MNIVLISGKVVSEIEFQFIIKSKNLSIAKFKIELNNKSIVQIKAYNELADYCYKELKRDDNILIDGTIREDSIKCDRFLIKLH